MTSLYELVGNRTKAYLKSDTATTYLHHRAHCPEPPHPGGARGDSHRLRRKALPSAAQESRILPFSPKEQDHEVV